MIVQLNFKSGKARFLPADRGSDQSCSSLREHFNRVRPCRISGRWRKNFGVNRNTIAKAYSELEGLGVIETIPGKVGCFLKQNNSSPLRKGNPAPDVDRRYRSEQSCRLIISRSPATNF